ncbi:hypothetical protein GCM10009733_084200 [Nonomuraea maheshkhaliensis]|uniref:SLC26A/SulP transporter domain-containing protein n=1 Tax=Nonomuraea maheshkhaliensis TaxID=419590 RepID=A0ABN2GNU3_9ACTN
MCARPAWLHPRVARIEFLAGLVVALALIPGAISFSIIARVDPSVGLFASVTMAVAIAVAGGRPAMISAATGAIALVVAPLAREHGFGYLIATVILGGLIPIVLGALGVAKLMRFVPRSVMVGFVNTLAGLGVPTVGDRGTPPSSLPVPGLPDVPLTLDTLTLPAPYALAFALVGLMESLMTAKLVDDITDARSSKTRESIGQGLANIVTGLFGGMGGCAMIGQTMINVKNGARTRLSTFTAGVMLMVLCIVFGPWVSQIPTAALVAVMALVSFGTFGRHSVAPATPRRVPAGEITSWSSPWPSWSPRTTWRSVSPPGR